MKRGEGALDRHARPRAISTKDEVEAHFVAGHAGRYLGSIAGAAGYRSSPLRPHHLLKPRTRRFGEERGQDQRARQDQAPPHSRRSLGGLWFIVYISSRVCLSVTVDEMSVICVPH